MHTITTLKNSRFILFRMRFHSSNLKKRHRLPSPTPFPSAISRQKSNLEPFKGLTVPPHLTAIVVDRTITLVNYTQSNWIFNANKNIEFGPDRRSRQSRPFRDCFRDRWPAKRNRKIYSMSSIAVRPLFNIEKSIAGFDFPDCDSSEKRFKHDKCTISTRADTIKTRFAIFENTIFPGETRFRHEKHDKFFSPAKWPRFRFPNGKIGVHAIPALFPETCRTLSRLARYSTKKHANWIGGEGVRNAMLPHFGLKTLDLGLRSIMDYDRSHCHTLSHALSFSFRFFLDPF